MSRALRRKAILTLLGRRPASTQGELQCALSKRGMVVGQATLSRDLHALGMMKGPRGYEPATTFDRLPSSTQVMISEFVLTVRAAQNLLVLKTCKGGARLVAAGLEEENWPEAIGTLAGENTILIVSADSKSARKLAARIRSEGGFEQKLSVRATESNPQKLEADG